MALGGTPARHRQLADAPAAGGAVEIPCLARGGAEHSLPLMAWKRRAQGGVLAFVGFLLSPLSWWNDLVVNVPLAMALAWMVAALYPPAFKPALVIGYWLTNVLGLVLLHLGARRTLTRETSKPYAVRDLVRALGWSLLYTLLILLLIQTGVLQPLDRKSVV